MTGAERVRAELEVLGLDVSRHVLDFYAPLLDALGVTRSRDLLHRRSRAELLVAGVKVATQTPPVRSGRRVVFLTLDDATGPVDATFFEDAQGPYAATVFHSWLLVVRGVLRRTGPRGVSLRATGAWELPLLWDAWTEGGLRAVQELLARERSWDGDVTGQRSAGRRRAGRRGRSWPGRRSPSSAAGRRATVPRQPDPGGGVRDRLHGPGYRPATGRRPPAAAAASGIGAGATRAGGMGGGSGAPARSSSTRAGYRQSPYADVKPPGENTRDTRRMLPPPERSGQRAAADQRRRRGEPPRKLWHASPGSRGR